MTASEWQHARNILCVRLDYLGDVLMTTPAIRALHESIPGTHITLLTSAIGTAAAHYIPDIDDAIVYQAPWLKHSERHTREEDFAMIETLAARRFDAAVIFTVYSQSPLPAAMLCHLAGIPLRLAHCRENPYALLTHWVAETEPHNKLRHEVRRQLDLVAAIGAQSRDERLVFCVPQTDMQRMCRLLDEIGINREKPWIIMHPGASAASRRYPPEYMTAAARELSERLPCRVILTGSSEEAPLAEHIAAQVPHSHSLAGQLQLGELAALIGLTPLLISNNTGPVHLAAALGTPVVDLYALTNPQHAPWKVASRVLYHDVPCRFCYKSVCPEGHHRCLTEVSPSQVVSAALELLQQTANEDPAPPKHECMSQNRWLHQLF